MKTLFTTWSLGTLALVATIQFAQTTEPKPGAGAAAVVASAPMLPSLPRAVKVPATNPVVIADVKVEAPKVEKPKAEKKAQKKLKKKMAKAHKPKKKDPVLAAVRKVDRAIKRIF
ncbi:MAG: hypothetical protein ACRCU5_01620 [Rhizobiaceae bacterium]